MAAYLHGLCDACGVAFVVSSMLAMGLGQRPESVVAALNDWRAMAMALIVNFVISPLLVVGLIRVIPLQPAHAIGLLILGGTAGAPFLPKLAEVAGGSLAYSVGLMLLLMLTSIAFMPLALPYLVPGLLADPWHIAKPLLLLMFLPLTIGFVLGRAGAAWIARLLKFVRKISNLTFAMFVMLLIGMNLTAMAGTIGSYAIGTYGLYVLCVVGVGYLLGGADKSKKVVFALAAGNRNIAAALVVATASFEDPAVKIMLLVAAVTGLVLLLVIARCLRARPHS